MGGIYHHSVAGSAGPLQEAHIVLLHELIAIEEGNSSKCNTYLYVFLCLYVSVI